MGFKTILFQIGVSVCVLAYFTDAVSREILLLTNWQILKKYLWKTYFLTDKIKLTLKMYSYFSTLSIFKIDPREASSIYDFTVRDTFGNEVPLARFRGQVVLFVNIASNDGLAKAQYAGLMELRKRYHHRGKWSSNKLDRNRIKTINFL